MYAVGRRGNTPRQAASRYSIRDARSASWRGSQGSEYVAARVACPASPVHDPRTSTARPARRGPGACSPRGRPRPRYWRGYSGGTPRPATRRSAACCVNGGAKLVHPGGAKLVHLTLCGTRCWGVVPVARRDCMKVWGRMQSGERAEGSNGAQAPLFRDFVSGSWRAACYEPCKPSTKTSKAWALNNQLLPVFGAMPLDRIDRTGVIRWFEDYSARAPGGANSVLLVFRQIMNHAIARGHIETNPTRGLGHGHRVVVAPAAHQRQRAHPSRALVAGIVWCRG